MVGWKTEAACVAKRSCETKIGFCTIEKVQTRVSGCLFGFACYYGLGSVIF
ncbi:hypothetical protein GCWU000324_01962 [Kingella oralis ATCC 51147]|uniref:Uncharacterized protein n=1 Tax=Kingella oralis ATCC 51147 TaxID=629741 RepID=C4GIU1_9NEIS|nr:hypothetical protein GCWU000324_01962 [Kingella oralis ATCC 51147]